jgi:hypothetical protein
LKDAWTRRQKEESRQTSEPRGKQTPSNRPLPFIGSPNRRHRDAVDRIDYSRKESKTSSSIAVVNLPV